MNFNNIINFSRQLRKEQTKAEKLLWEKIRNRKLKGYKFRRQHPVKNTYVVDFYCAQKKCVIEVDGGIHNLREVKDKDRQKEEFLLKQNFKIMRINNEEIYSDIDLVLKKIVDFIEL